MSNNLYQNLAWYADDNRFQGIVTDLEEKADELEILDSSQSTTGEESADYKQKKHAFRKTILFHAKKSGYSQKHPEVLDVNKFFFASGKINRKALEGFEKDIVKDHMYQKHLWEFMGTTGHLSLVSKLALAANGKKAADLTPVSAKGKEVQKSPISPILSEIPDSVPLYLYSDGTVSTLYDKNRAKLKFDTTQDTTGFDWKRTGWDPNYDIEHKDLRIVYNPKTGEFTAIKVSGGTLTEEVVQIFTPEKASPLNLKVILAENEGAILDDPFYIFIYKKLYEIILQNKKLSEEEEDYRDELLALIDRGLEAIGADKITAIVKSSDDSEDVDDKQVIKAYREILGDRVAPSVRIISADDAANAQAKSLDKVIARRDEQAGVNLGAKLAYLAGLGLTGPVLSRAVKTSTMAQNANFLSISDLKEAGFEDEDARAISKFEVPLSEQSAFSKVLFNLMDEYSLLATAGLGERQIADLVYDTIANGNKHNEYIELSLSLERICTTKSTIFNGDVKANVRKAFEDELGNLSLERRTKRLEEKVNNAILRYGIIKETTGMTEAEVVAQLVKSSEAALAPVPTIRYMSSSEPTTQKYIIRLKFNDLIEDALNSEKVVTFLKPIDFSNIEIKSRYNLFDSEDLAKWLRTSSGKKSGFDTDTLANLVSTIRKSEVAKSQLDINQLTNLTGETYSDNSALVLLNKVTAELDIQNGIEDYGLDSQGILDPQKYGLSRAQRVDASMRSPLSGRGDLSAQDSSNGSASENTADEGSKDVIGVDLKSSNILMFIAVGAIAGGVITAGIKGAEANKKEKERKQADSEGDKEKAEKAKKDRDKAIGIGVGVGGGLVLGGVGIYYLLYKHDEARNAEQVSQALNESANERRRQELDSQATRVEGFERIINPSDIESNHSAVNNVDNNNVPQEAELQINDLNSISEHVNNDVNQPQNIDFGAISQIDPNENHQVELNINDNIEINNDLSQILSNNEVRARDIRRVDDKESNNNLSRILPFNYDYEDSVSQEIERINFSDLDVTNATMVNPYYNYGTKDNFPAPRLQEDIGSEF